MASKPPRRLFYQHPHIKVIILTIHNTQEYQAKAKQDAVEGLEELLGNLSDSQAGA